jgi:hypothetical protein
MNATSHPPFGPIPVWKMEKLRLGELDPEEAAALRDRIANDPAAAEQFRSFVADDLDFSIRYPARRVLGPVRASSRSSRAAPVFAFSGLLAAAVALFTLLPGKEQVPSVNTPLEETTAKGEARFGNLLVFRQTPEGPQRLFDGATVAPGELLGLAYEVKAAAKSLYGVIFSVDGRGSVTLHHPPGPEASTRLDTEGTVRLDQAYELDDAPAFERFFFVASEKPIDVPELLENARRLGPERAGPLNLPPGLEQTSVTLKKTRK